MASWFKDARVRWRGSLDWRRALRDLPDAANLERAARRYAAELEPQWAAYTSTISTQEMAVSLEVAAIIAGIIVTRRPRRILDLGSGFSSYVVRRVSAEAGGARVKSVDDDVLWLEKTRAYLSERGMPSDNVVHVDTLDGAERGAWDLVFHDIGSMETRRRLLPLALDAADRDCGWVLLDDCHKPNYAAAVNAELRMRQLEGYSLRAIGCDRFRRFDVLVPVGRSSVPRPSLGGSP